MQLATINDSADDRLALIRRRAPGIFVERINVTGETGRHGPVDYGRGMRAFPKIQP
jgi:hypothetical protein